MKFIKKIIACLMIATGYNLIMGSSKKNPEFDALMQKFAQDFQKFSKVALHGTKEEKKELYTIGAKSLESSAQLYNYVKKHPHEKRYVPKEQRQALENMVHKFPTPTEQGKKIIQENQKKLNDLIEQFMHASHAIPEFNKQTEPFYNKVVVKAIKELLELQKFINKNRGYLISSTQKDKLIQAINKLKTIHIPSKKTNQPKTYSTAAKKSPKKQTAQQPQQHAASVAQTKPAQTSQAQVAHSPNQSQTPQAHAAEHTTTTAKPEEQSTATKHKDHAVTKLKEPAKKVVQAVRQAVRQAVPATSQPATMTHQWQQPEPVSTRKTK